MGTGGWMFLATVGVCIALAWLFLARSERS